jgi:hypothetical protein
MDRPSQTRVRSDKRHAVILRTAVPIEIIENPTPEG